MVTGLAIAGSLAGWLILVAQVSLVRTTDRGMGRFALRDCSTKVCAGVGVC
jgi:hypothetical protein